MTARLRVAITPPLKPHTGVVILKGRSSMPKPRGGRLLMIENLIPHAWSFATAAWVRAVKTLSSVTRVPSTSETSVEIFGEEFPVYGVIAI
jgi:hypothetical protein